MILTIAGAQNNMGDCEKQWELLCDRILVTDFFDSTRMYRRESVYTRHKELGRAGV